MTNCMTIKTNQDQTKKKGKIETFVVSMIIGLVAAVGILASFAVLIDADVACWNKAVTMVVYFLLAGSITGGILLTD